MVVNRLMSPQWPSSYGYESGRSLGRSLAGSDSAGLLTQPAAPKQHTTFRALMVPLDGTPLGERALPLAISIARRSQAELRIVHVHTPMDSVYYPYTTSAFDDGQYRKQVEYLERISSQVADAAGIIVIPECLQSRDVVDGLCEAANQGIDLVVAATDGHGWFERLWYGSTVHKLIQRLAPPLLVLRGDGLRATIAPNRWLRRMLVPLDGSEQASDVLEPAAALGSLYDASYSLLTVVPKSGTVQRRIIASDPAGAMRRQSAARHYLNQAVDRMTQNSARAMARMAVTDEPVAHAIVSRAEASRIDCIAMATSGRSGLTRWFHPSVTRRVIELSQVPVLVVRGGQGSDVRFDQEVR